MPPKCDWNGRNSGRALDHQTPRLVFVREPSRRGTNQNKRRRVAPAEPAIRQARCSRLWKARSQTPIAANRRLSRTKDPELLSCPSTDLVGRLESAGAHGQSARSRTALTQPPNLLDLRIIDVRLETIGLIWVRFCFANQRAMSSQLSATATTVPFASPTILPR